MRERGIVRKIEGWSSELTAWRHDIHRHPETAFEERRTSDFVAQKLASFGLTAHRGIAKTGVVASLKVGSSTRAIGLRADLDALDVQELNAFDHVSTIPGKMHACGHDGHTTMLLAAARYLTEEKSFDGTVHFIFQPAEENEGGARVMVEEGLFRFCPCEGVYGMHNMPGIPEGSFAVRKGPIMAACDTFEITITAKGAHAAFPQTGKDSIVIASQLVGALQTIVSRNVSPIDQGVVSVTQIHAGDTWNVLPEVTTLRGTTRSFKKSVQDVIENRMRELCEGFGKAHGVAIALDYARRYPAVVNHAAETDHCIDVMKALVGDAMADGNTDPVMGAEDFACMLEAKPGCYLFIGNGETRPAIHNPRYDFNDAILPLGASYWVRLVEHLLRITDVRV